jgi:hypothetical protein
MKRRGQSGVARCFTFGRLLQNEAKKVPQKRPRRRANGWSVAGGGSVFRGRAAVRHHQKWR